MTNTLQAEQVLRDQVDVVKGSRSVDEQSAQGVDHNHHSRDPYAQAPGGCWDKAYGAARPPQDGLPLEML